MGIQNFSLSPLKHPKEVHRIADHMPKIKNASLNFNFFVNKGFKSVNDYAKYWK